MGKSHIILYHISIASELTMDQGILKIVHSHKSFFGGAGRERKGRIAISFLYTLLVPNGSFIYVIIRRYR